MAKKGIICILIVLFLILTIAGLYAIGESLGNNSKSVELKVYSEGPIELSKIIEDIETRPYYEGYDNNTLNWMKSLGSKEVFSGNGTLVIMNSYDASKIPSQFATDVIIVEHFNCDIVEKHSLGNVKSSKNVLLVENVEYLHEEIIDLGLA